MANKFPQAYLHNRIGCDETLVTKVKISKESAWLILSKKKKNLSFLIVRKAQDCYFKPFNVTKDLLKLIS